MALAFDEKLDFLSRCELKLKLFKICYFKFFSLQRALRTFMYRAYTNEKLMLMVKLNVYILLTLIYINDRVAFCVSKISQGKSC